MPEAPQYSQERIRTQGIAAPLQNPNIATPDAFGAAIAEGASSGARAAFAGQERRDQIAERERLRAANTKAQATYLKYSEEEGKVRSQGYQKTGDNVRGLPDDYNKSVGALAVKFSDELKDSRMWEKRQLQFEQTLRISLRVRDGRFRLHRQTSLEILLSLTDYGTTSLASNG